MDTNIHSPRSTQPKLALERPGSEVCIGQFPLNSKDTIRVAIGEFEGHQIVNFRRWFRADDGADRPTKKGLAFAVRHLPAFATIVNDALARARADGLLPHDGGE